MKLYNRLELENADSVGESSCKESLDDRHDDLELLDSCFEDASDLSEGISTTKCDMNSKESEFTYMVSWGKCMPTFQKSKKIIFASICIFNFITLKKIMQIHVMLLRTRLIKYKVIRMLKVPKSGESLIDEDL